MNNQKAIEKIRKDICCERPIQHHCKDGCMNGKEHCAYSLAIEALEKQIPKKPNIEGDGYADGQLVYDTWICPNCEEHYEIDYDNHDYCPKCGQALDWNEC